MCQTDKKLTDFCEKWRPMTLDTFKPTKDGDVEKKVKEVLAQVEEFKKIAH